jgi:hypothetical protein
MHIAIRMPLQSLLIARVLLMESCREFSPISEFSQKRQQSVASFDGNEESCILHDPSLREVPQQESEHADYRQRKAKKDSTKLLEAWQRIEPRYRFRILGSDSATQEQRTTRPHRSPRRHGTLPRFEAILVDSQASDLGFEGGSGNSKFACCAVWA